jgi:hypothetical protein
MVTAERVDLDLVATVGVLDECTNKCLGNISTTYAFFFDSPMPSPAPRPTARAISQKMTHPINIQKVRFFNPHFLSSLGGTGGGTEPGRDMCWSWVSTCSLNIYGLGWGEPSVLPPCEEGENGCPTNGYVCWPGTTCGAE